MDQPTAELLAQYWAGEITPDDTPEAWARAQAWLGAPENAERADLLQAAWTATRPTSVAAAVSTADVAALADRVLARLDVSGPVSSHAAARVPFRAATTSTRRPARPTLLTRGVLGAVTAIALTASVAGYTVWTRRAASPSVALAAPQVYTTGNGQRATIELNDGTRVTLNVASQLEVPATFGRSDRRVVLRGEAAFSVAHASASPFTIDAGNTRTTVLGTEFAVRAYAGDSAVQVSVLNGKVSVDGVALTAREMGRFANGAAEVQRGAPVERALAFSAGQLVLTGEPLRDARAQLERWYDVELVFGTPALAERRLETTVGVGSANELAQMLEFLLTARVVQRGRVLTLYAR